MAVHGIEKNHSVIVHVGSLYAMIVFHKFPESLLCPNVFILFPHAIEDFLQTCASWKGSEMLWHLVAYTQNGKYITNLTVID